MISMSYSINYSISAARRLNRLDAKMRGRIRAKVALVAEDPTAPNRSLDHLTGMDGYRLRVGDWRVIFELDHEARALNVRAIRERGSAYQRRDQ